MKNKVLFLLFLCAVLLLSACGANKSDVSAVLEATASPTAAPTPKPTAEPTPTPAPVEIYGVSVEWDAEELEFRDTKIEDGGEALMEAIPSLPNLRRVDMTGCSLTDEELGAFQDAYPDIVFVWEVSIYTFLSSTEADYFITNADAGVRYGWHQAGPGALKYMRYLTALDLGHVHLDDISFIADMPHLKYLILADNNLMDLSCLSGLKELEWLELFGSCAVDFTPILGCTALRDLNLCYTYMPADALYDLLSQMTWLRRLWITGTNLSWAQIDALREALPNTEIWYRVGDESTGGTWRYDEDYYAMRDAFHMYYMDIMGNTVPRKSEEELAALHEKYWGY